MTGVAGCQPLMYTVRMTRINATEARRRLFHLLDAAEQGEEVILERRGTRFRLVREDAPAAAAGPVSSPLAIDDPALLSGEWSWEQRPDGDLALRAGRRER